MLKEQIPKTEKPWETRFWSKVKIGTDDECWPWTAGKTKLGYGVFWFDGHNPGYAHRIAFTLFFGEVPNGLEVDHKCDNTSCSNPNHLQAVSHGKNIRRSSTAGRPRRIGPRLENGLFYSGGT